LTAYWLEFNSGSFWGGLHYIRCRLRWWLGG